MSEYLQFESSPSPLSAFGFVGERLLQRRVQGLITGMSRLSIAHYSSLDGSIKSTVDYKGKTRRVELQTEPEAYLMERTIMSHDEEHNVFSAVRYTYRGEFDAPTLATFELHEGTVNGLAIRDLKRTLNTVTRLQTASGDMYIQALSKQ